MSKFINMDFDSSTNKWWVEYIDDSNITQKIEYNTEAEAKAKYNQIV